MYCKLKSTGSVYTAEQFLIDKNMPSGMFKCANFKSGFAVDTFCGLEEVNHGDFILKLDSAFFGVFSPDYFEENFEPLNCNFCHKPTTHKITIDGYVEWWCDECLKEVKSS